MELIEINKVGAQAPQRVALDRDAYGDYWRYLDQLCRERDVTLEPAHEVKEKHSLLALVAGGMGVSILPAHVAETARGSLRIVPIEDLPGVSPAHSGGLPRPTGPRVRPTF